VAAFVPSLLDGLTQLQDVYTQSTSAALFGNLEWKVTDKLRVIPGLRYNYDKKATDFNQPVFGGQIPIGAPNAAAYKAAQNSILAPIAYKASVDETNLSGQLTVAYDLLKDVNVYATYAKGYKPAGLNVAGVPTTTTPIAIKPEDVTNYEVGIKTRPFAGATFNLAAFDTEIKDYQTNVVANVVNTLRGYLANADKVRVRGAEFDASLRLSDRFELHGSGAYTDAYYVSFPNAPLPIEETGRPIPNPAGAGTITAPFKDISGARLPGVSKWAGSVGGEYTIPSKFWGRDGDFFIGADVSSRSKFNSDPSASKFLDIKGYSLLNARVGFKGANGWDLYLWGHNVTDTEYYELLAVQSGGSGLVVGTLGDPRTVGVTLRGSF
ncbi:MAG: TonB-dependent receptor, partial [Terricaulis silvestris]